MLCVDGKGAPTQRMKEFCPECGLPRDPELAKIAPCGACGALGTQKTAPFFDEFGERVPDEVVEQRNAERFQHLQEGRERRRAEQKPVETAAEVVAPVVEKPVRKVQVADLFLAAMRG